MIMKKTVAFSVLSMLLLVNQLWAGEKLGAFASMTMATSQVAPDGTVVVDNLVSQPYIGLTYGPITVFNWNNYDIEKHRFNEHDFGIFAELFKCDAFEFYADFQYWEYPSYSYETAASVGTKYAGWVSGNFKFTRQSGHGIWDSGYRYWIEVSKNFPLGGLSLTPKIQSAYLDDFFGVSGLAHATAGLSISYQIAEKINLTGEFNYQEGFEMPSHQYGGVTLSSSF